VDKLSWAESVQFSLAQPASQGSFPQGSLDILADSLQ